MRELVLAYSPEIGLHVLVALAEQRIAATELLICATEAMASEAQIFFAGVALRYGADPHAKIGEVSLLSHVQQRKVPSAIRETFEALIHAAQGEKAERGTDKCAALLDNPLLSSHRPKTTEVMRDHATKVLARWLPNITNIEFAGRAAIKALNLSACETLLAIGWSPGYMGVTYLLFRLQRYRAEEDPLAFAQVRAILEEVIAFGYIPDQEQRAHLERIDRSMSEKIFAPLISFVRTKEGKVASSLGARSSDELSLRAKAISPMQAEIAAVRRQITCAPTNEPDISAVLDRSAGSFDVASYVDEQGRRWAFASGTIMGLLADRKNPITGDPLPEEFLLDLGRRRSVVRRLGLPIDAGEQGPKEQERGPREREEDFVRILACVENTAAIYGRARDFSARMNANERMRLLRSMEYEEIPLSTLPESYQKRILVHAIYAYVRKNYAALPTVYEILPAQ